MNDSEPPDGGETELGLRSSPASSSTLPEVTLPEVTLPELTQPEAVLPPPVRVGDRVGVAALSGPCDPERLERGLAALRGLGYEPVEASNLRTCHGLFAGADDERLAAFHRLAADPSLKAIFFTRGGHGVLRLLPRLDWQLLARHPRAYVGYSDLTPFLLQVVQRLGWVAFHGPMVAVDLARGLDAAEVESLTGALAGTLPHALPLAGGEGAAGGEGRLLGGCLTMISACIGTPFAADLRQAVLFLEDVAEPPYRVDRMLTHLRLSGSLAMLRGVVFGHRTGADRPTDGATGDEQDREGWVEARALFRELDPSGTLPVAWGLPAGHAAPNLTLPLGLRVQLAVAGRALIVGRRRGNT